MQIIKKAVVFMTVTGKEALTLKQLRNSFGGGSNKKYKIEWSSDTDAAYRSNQTEAEPGSIIPVCSKTGECLGLYIVYDTSKSDIIMTGYQGGDTLSDLPAIVREAINNMPESKSSSGQTRAVNPPTGGGGNYQWFVIPACDVYVVFQG